MVLVLAACTTDSPDKVTDPPAPTPTPSYEFTTDQVMAIEAALDLNLSVYGDDLGRPLTADDRQAICQDWKEAGWDFESIPDDVYTVRHGELPMAIREAMGLALSEYAGPMVKGYCEQYTSSATPTPVPTPTPR